MFDISETQVVSSSHGSDSCMYRAYNLNEWIAGVCHLPHKCRKKSPLRFKKSQNIRIIIDCTEFFCAQPRSFHRQGNLYSSYTSHTTFGFISDEFECSISDREIPVQSGLHRGDLVLADRRFEHI